MSELIQELVVITIIIVMLSVGVLQASGVPLHTPSMHTVAHPNCTVDVFRSEDDDSLCPDNNERDI